MFATILLLLAIIGLILYGIYSWATLNDGYFEKRNLPHLKPYFLLGNVGGFFLKRHRPNEFITYLYNSFPTEKIFGLFDFRKPLFFVRDVELLKQLAIKDFDHFPDHRAFIDERTDVLFGNSLPMLSGQKWRDMRATLSPVFTGSKMRHMFELVGDCAWEMSHFFKQQALDGQPIHCEMKELFSKYTNDVIASSAFGITVNSFRNSENEFLSAGKKMMNFASITAALKLLLLRNIPSIMCALKIQFIDASAGTFFRNMVLDTIAVRNERNIFRPDFINLLMQLKNQGLATSQQQHVDLIKEKSTDGFATVEESSIGKVVVNREWNDNEIVAQAFIFFLAGLDTSATVLSYLVYELAINSDIQQKLYKEVAETNSKLGGNKLAYDELQKMEYMDMVVSETLRLWPPALITDRVCVKDYTYSDSTTKFTIEKDTLIWIPIYAFHHDPKNFPNPSKFDPERFSAENKGNIMPGSYMPFGVGPRNCIGSRFALMEVKVAVYYLLLNFKFEPNERTQIPLKLAKSLAGGVTEQGIHLELKLR